MKRYFALTFLILSSVLLQGCYTSGSAAPAPVNVAVVSGDSSATVSWDMVPGVEYWVFSAAATDVTPQSCVGLPQCKILMRAVSPALVSGLTNGTPYSLTINGRTDGGKGGSGSPSVQAVPRLAGAVWSVATPMGTNDMHGVAYGTVFVAAGNNGALFSSTDGVLWTAQAATPPTTANLNAASYYAGNYLVVGAGGVILRSPDATTWTPQTSGTTNDLYAVSNYGAAGYVATGANGTIIYSGDGVTWTAATSGSANPLYGVTYGNGMYVAVGAAGTLLTSINGTSWSSSVASSTSNTLKSVAYAPVIGTNSMGTFVAVGANGTVVTSTNGGTSWSTATSPFAPGSIINAVTYGRQFVAVAEDGSIFVSVDGLSWTPTTSTPANSTALYAITHGLYDYTAIGAAGLNMHSK